MPTPNVSQFSFLSDEFRHVDPVSPGHPLNFIGLGRGQGKARSQGRKAPWGGPFAKT